jgi:hypothetical protein
MMQCHPVDFGWRFPWHFTILKPVARCRLLAGMDTSAALDFAARRLEVRH